MIGIFPYEASLVRLIGARLMAISGDWETGRSFPNMQTEESAPQNPMTHHTFTETDFRHLVRKRAD